MKLSSAFLSSASRAGAHEGATRSVRPHAQPTELSLHSLSRRERTPTKRPPGWHRGHIAVRSPPARLLGVPARSSGTTQERRAKPFDGPLLILRSLWELEDFAAKVSQGEARRLGWQVESQDVENLTGACCPSWARPLRLALGRHTWPTLLALAAPPPPPRRGQGNVLTQGRPCPCFSPSLQEGCILPPHPCSPTERQTRPPHSPPGFPVPSLRARVCQAARCSLCSLFPSPLSPPPAPRFG